MTARASRKPGRSRKPVLSLFPGIDLLGRGFELEGFCVVRGPDILWGQDVREFHPCCHAFAGVIGGSPCQDFSIINRNGPTGYGREMLREFVRCVQEAAPDWFVLENVAQVPDIVVPGYIVQRFNLNASECGLRQNRLRCFQFGSRDGKPLVIARCVTTGARSRCCLATEGDKDEPERPRRSWAEFCELQGLPRSFDLPGWPRKTKYRAVGNGVPISMARVIAIAVHSRPVTPWARVCVCGCGREVLRNATMATATCRKTMQRRRERDAAGVTGPGIVTTSLSLSACGV